ncbi:serine hydrolase [Chryseoglobus sp. 28M-23]|uniref:serine hydrolase n=1 Tax=Chryseoglobus sp. 28M-23 TaxID=2772253 RepID=UPI001CD1151B|nr:serine hydrolase [Chryseoglobus sp. 28M-23]
MSDLATGGSVFAVDERIVLPTASVGKILLLIEVSARLTERSVSDFAIIDRVDGDAVADSGLWRHLQAPAFPLGDLAALVGATSDNLATNALLRQIGLPAVRARSEKLGLARTALLDRVRDERGPDHAPQLSVGSTAELAWLFHALAHGHIVDEETSQRVLGWLSLNGDLSLVAGSFGRDPLAHRGVEHNTWMVNKTGTDAGVRSEAGVLRGPRAGVSYAVSVHFEDTDLGRRLRVIDALRTFGLDLLEYVH